MILYHSSTLNDTSHAKGCRNTGVACMQPYCAFPIVFCEQVDGNISQWEAFETLHLQQGLVPHTSAEGLVYWVQLSYSVQCCYRVGFSPSVGSYLHKKVFSVMHYAKFFQQLSMQGPVFHESQCVTRPSIHRNVNNTSNESHACHYWKAYGHCKYLFSAMLFCTFLHKNP